MKSELVTLVVLIPIVIVMGVLLWRWPSTPAATPLANTPVVSPTASPVAESTAPDVVVEPTQVADATNRQLVHISIVANGVQKDFEVSQASSTSVANVMARAEAQGLTTKTHDYGGTLGLFFEEINGVANDPARQLYWHLYINNERSPLGASTATVKAGDQVTWRLEVAHNEN